MGEIDGSIGMECYAVFALQQPLTLDALESAAVRAELPIAAGVPVDTGLVAAPVVVAVPHRPPDADRAAALLAAAPELSGSDPGRRITD